MKRKLIIALSLCLLATSFTACGKKEKETEVDKVEVEIEQIPVEEEVQEAEAVEEEYIEDELPAGMYFSELTHEPLDESIMYQRPIAVMVDNEKTALPHFGVNEADIVYEMMNSTQNDRVTRFMVLVKDWAKIEQLGSIRSTRPTNIILASEYNAVLCHDGGPYHNDVYFAQDLMSDHFSGIFSRVNNGKAREFTEYILPGDLDKAFKNAKFGTEYEDSFQGQHWQFAPKCNPITLEDKSDSKACTSIAFPFKHNGSKLNYNESDKKYYYSEYGEPHNDGATNVQLSFDNVIIQKCTFSQLDEHGYLIYNVIDSGLEAYYCTNGKCIPCTWTKDGTSFNKQTKFYDMEGNEIRINTGHTYIALVPADTWDQLEIN